jgi:hypothetical protein
MVISHPASSYLLIDSYYMQSYTAPLSSAKRLQNTDPVTPLGRGYRANATQKEHRAREDAMLRFHRNGTSNHSYVIFWETKDPSDTTSESTEGGTNSLGLLKTPRPRRSGDERHRCQRTVIAAKLS